MVAPNGNGGGGLLERLGLGRMVVISGVLLTALLVALSVLDLSLDHSVTEHGAEQAAGNLARVLGAQTEAAVTSIDQSLKRVLDAVHGRPLAALVGDGALTAAFKEMVGTVPFISALYVFDAQGDIVVTSRAPLATKFSVADREYFTVHRDHAGVGLFIGPPVIGRPTGRWALTLSRRIDGPDGIFAGVAMGVLDPVYLQKLYDAIDVGRYGVVSLILNDGRVLVRSPFDERMIGASVAQTPLFRAMREGGQRSGVDRGAYLSDGRVRITGFDLIDPGPLVIRVALDEEEILASWRQGALLYGFATAIFIALLAVGVAVLRRQLKARERAERASRESGRLAGATIDALTAQLCVLDDAGVVLVANRAWRAAAGYVGPPGAATGTGTNYLLTCEAATGNAVFAARAFAVGIRAVMAGAKAEYIQEYPSEEPEGRRWFVGRVTRFAGDGPLRVVVVHQDITHRRLIEDNLRDSERRLAKAQAIAHLGNWEEDLRDGTVFWSEEVFHIFGRAPRDFGAGGVSYLQFVHPDDRQALYDQEVRLIVGDEQINLDHRIVLPDGGVRFVNLQAELVRDSEGRPLRTVGTVLDITERKQAEAALRAAVQQAEVANRTKTEFLANMSHELNTPLNAVIGFSEMIAEDVCGPDKRERYCEFGRVILRSGRHLQTLISDVLDLSEIEAGQIALQEEAVDLGELVRERAQASAPEAEAAGITLMASDSSGNWGLFADRRMLKQILRNLLSNALKFTPEGGAVGVTVARSEEGIRLVVEDTGVGMAPEDIPRAFDRFSQLDGSLTRDHDGAGLGLALTKLLVEKHGGTVTIASSVNRGTTVTICFPPERSFDLGGPPGPSLICVGSGCTGARCQPSLPKPADAPCKQLSMP